MARPRALSTLTLGASLLAALSACSNAGADDESGGGGGGPSGADAAVGGSPIGGTPVGGDPVGGTPVGGDPVGGTPVGGDPVGGTPVGGDPVGGTPADDWPAEADTPWTPTTPANLRDGLPAVPGQKPAECGAEWVTALRGYVLAPGGAPVEGAKGQLCVHLYPSDNLLCLQPGTTGADGIFTVEVPENARCITKAALRVLKPGVGKATMYCEVDVVGTEPVVVIDTPLVVFQTRRALDLPPEGDELMSRAVRFDDGLVLDFTPDLYYSGGGIYDDLGGRRVDPAAPGLCFFGAEDAPAGLYALYPEGQIDAPGFPVHVPNTTGLAAGSKVEFFVLGGLDCKRADGTGIPEAAWETFGTGTVSADGSTIDSDPGVGVPCLTWLGYRQVP